MQPAKPTGPPLTDGQIEQWRHRGACDRIQTDPRWPTQAAPALAVCCWLPPVAAAAGAVAVLLPPHSIPVAGSDASVARAAGYVAVSGVLPETLIAQAATEATSAAESSGLGFPTPGAPGCNSVALYPRLLDAATQLLGSADLRLLDSLVPPVAAPSAEALPPLTTMCGSHSLLMPSSTAGPEAVYALIFLDDSASATLLDQDNREDKEWAASSSDAAAVSTGEEIVVQGGLGVVLFFRSELYHRSTGGGGAAQRVGFRKAHASYIQGGGAGFGLVVSGMPRDWVASLTTSQRTLLGFPPPGSPYWTDDTIHAVSHHCAHAVACLPAHGFPLKRIRKQPQLPNCDCVCACQCQCQCDECDVIVYLLMTDGAAVSGWNGPEGEPAKPMDMRDYIAAAKHTPPYPEASRALTTPPVPAPEASRAQLPSIDNAWHFKGARGQNATLGYVAADLLARWSEKLLVAAIEMTLCGFRLIERGRRGDEVGSTRAGAANGPR